MGEITYRKATADDLEALARLRWAMQFERQEDHPSDPETWETYLAAYRDAFAEQIAQGGFDAWLAEDGGQAVSCVVLLWWRTPPIFDQLVRRRGMVSSVYTLPEYRRRGISRQLMLMLIARGEGVADSPPRASGRRRWAARCTRASASSRATGWSSTR